MVLEKLIDKEFDLLKDIMKNKGTIKQNGIKSEAFHFLHSAGFIFLFRKNNKYFISMPDDIYNIIAKINLDSFQKKLIKPQKFII